MVSWPPLEVVQLGGHWGDFKGCFVSFAFANSDFAVAIFVNNSMKFWSASAVLPLRDTIPFNALVRSDATFMMSVSGVTCKFVIYWCLKNTVSLILVALVFTM